MKNKLRQKIKSIFLAVVLSFSAVFVFAGCSSNTAIAGIHMSSDEVVSVPYGNFSYEGINVTVEYVNGNTTEIPLTEEMIPEYERLKFYKMGEQDVSVVFRNKYETTMKINVILNRFNDVYQLNGYECVYDGLPHSVTLNHELPEGATVTYPYGNVFTNAGTYEVTAVLSKRGYESKTLSTTLTILQAEKDVSGVVFEDATLVYNGEMRTIEATNVPEGIEVSYEYRNFDTSTKVNKIVNVGKYRVIAHFTDENVNYKKIPDKEAILTITKADYDMSNIQLKDVTREYDGEEYNASITNANLLPAGVSVSYKYLNENDEPVASNAKAGKYTIVAEFKRGDELNYNPIEPLRATLTVTKQIIKISNKVTFESKTVNFDEAPQSLFISGTLPSGVSVEYENNGQIYVGEYIITAKFTADNPNYAVDVEEMIAYLVINRVRRSVKMLDPLTGEYTLDFSSDNIIINGTEATVIDYDPTVFRLASVKFFDPLTSEIVQVKDMVDGTLYEYIVNFEYIDENLANSIILSAESGLFTYIEA